VNIVDDKIKATKAELVALAAHASKELYRPHVNAIYFAPATGVAVSTDGHRLCIAEFDAASGIIPFLAPLTEVLLAIKLTPARGYALITSTGATVHDSTTKLIGQVPWVSPEATFPPYKQVVPPFSTNWAGVPVALDGQYVASIRLVTKAAKNAETFLFPPESTIDPIVAQVRSRLSDDEPPTTWTVVIMPMRSSAGPVNLSQCVARTRGAA
jgi:hypothetical protein